MSGETATTLTNYIYTDFQDEIVKTYYDDIPFINFIGRTPPEKTGDSMDWHVESAGYTAYNYTEGATPPSAGNQTNAVCTLAYKYAWITMQVTGHAMDALRGGNTKVLDAQLNKHIQAVLYKQEQNMVASFIAAIDDSTNYGGTNRSTHHLDSIVVAGGSAALTAAHLSSLYEGFKITPRTKPLDDLFLASSFEQITAYTEIGGAQYNESTFTWNSAETLWDIGKIKPAVTYNRKPWMEIPTMTNTYVFASRKSDCKIEEKRPITLKILGANDDSDKVLITSAMEFKHNDPYRAGRIEALAT